MKSTLKMLGIIEFIDWCMISLDLCSDGVKSISLKSWCYGCNWGQAWLSLDLKQGLKIILSPKIILSLKIIGPIQLSWLCHWAWMENEPNTGLFWLSWLLSLSQKLIHVRIEIGKRRGLVFSSGGDIEVMTVNVKLVSRSNFEAFMVLDLALVPM